MWRIGCEVSRELIDRKSESPEVLKKIQIQVGELGSREVG